MGANRRMRRAIARGQLRRQPLKRGILIAPKDTWPRFDGGISMELAGTSDEGAQIFSYTHSAAYQVRFAYLIINHTLFLPEARSVCRQAACEGCQSPPLVGLARSKHDDHLYRHLGPSYFVSLCQ